MSHERMILCRVEKLLEIENSVHASVHSKIEKNCFVSLARMDWTGFHLYFIFVSLLLKQRNEKKIAENHACKLKI